MTPECHILEQTHSHTHTLCIVPIAFTISICAGTHTQVKSKFAVKFGNPVLKHVFTFLTVTWYRNIQG